MSTSTDTSRVTWRKVFTTVIEGPLQVMLELIADVPDTSAGYRGGPYRGGGSP
jgi:hypothetical protein